MRFLRKIKASPNYPLLRESLEYECCRRQFFLSLILVGIFTIFVVALLAFDADVSANAIGLGVCFLWELLFLGFGIYKAYCWLEIFSHMEDYLFFPATLTKPIVHHSRYTHAVSYSLTFPNSDGKIITRETSAMFHNDNHPSLEDFNNQTVLVGYNGETDRIVVIKRTDT